MSRKRASAPNRKTVKGSGSDAPTSLGDRGLGSPDSDDEATTPVATRSAMDAAAAWTSTHDRFWEKAASGDGCWLWTGGLDTWGYGQFRARGRVFIASRMAWTLANGTIPPGQCVLHRCDVPACVRPDHLFLGTSRENTADKVAKGRQAKGVDMATSKLVEADIHEIRALLAGGHSRRSIARRFGVDHRVIIRIGKGLAWRHVPVSYSPIDQGGLVARAMRSLRRGE